ncbi:MAG: tetratricopeptide repeat protein [Thermodesulforhabdaceae bacterium]
MSRLYEIIRQMEERSSSPISHQEMVVISPPEEDSQVRKWWRSYRIAVLVGVVTIFAVAGITVGPRLIPDVATKSKSGLHEHSHVASTNSSAPFPSMGSSSKESSQELSSEPEKSEKKDTQTSDINYAQSNEPSISKENESLKQEDPLSSKDKIVSPEPEKTSDSKKTKARSTKTQVETNKKTGTPRRIDSPNPSTHTASRDSIPVTPTKTNSEKHTTPQQHLASVAAPQSGMIVLAEEARQRGDIDEAMQLYKQYLSLYQDPYVMNNLSGILITKGQIKEAEQILQEAFKLAPADPDIAANLIGVEIMLGRSNQACEIFSRFKKDSTLAPPPSIKALEPYLANCQ